MSKPFLDGIWANTLEDLKGKERADMLLDVICLASSDYNKKFPKWSTVEDLESILYEKTSFNSESMHRLRQTYLYIESILYLIADVHYANSQELIDEDDASIYYAYLHSLGDHPLFLHAVWFGHNGGYMRKSFSKFLRNELLNDPVKKHTISLIYPDLLKDDWLETSNNAKK